MNIEMGANTCVCCGSVISEDRMVCTMCEQREIKRRGAMQGNSVLDKEVVDSYEWLYASLEDIIDMC